MTKFYMFKMEGCGHCTAFFGRNGTEKGTQYQKLRADKTLRKHGVSLVFYNFGAMRSTGEYKRLPTEFEKLVTYAPFFVLEMDNGERRIYNGKRIASTMSKWILKCLTQPAKAAIANKHKSQRPVAEQPTQRASAPRTLKNVGRISFGAGNTQGYMKI